MFLTFNSTFENKNRSVFSFTKMRVSEQDIVLSDCVREFPCLSDKRTPEYHQRDVIGNCWNEVTNEAGLENGKIPFVFFKLYFCITK